MRFMAGGYDHGYDRNFFSPFHVFAFEAAAPRFTLRSAMSTPIQLLRAFRADVESTHPEKTASDNMIRVLGGWPLPEVGSGA